MTLFKQLAIAGVLAAIAGPVLGLDLRTADTVVTLMETIIDESGEEVYHGGGDVFFEADYNGHITAAGFSQATWSVVFDEVVTGYMATIPQDEFDAIFREAVAALEASALTDEQKAEGRKDMVLVIAEAQQARESGMPHAQAVLPLADRLYPMFYGE